VKSPLSRTDVAPAVPNEIAPLDCVTCPITVEVLSDDNVIVSPVFSCATVPAASLMVALKICPFPAVFAVELPVTAANVTDETAAPVVTV